MLQREIQALEHTAQLKRALLAKVRRSRPDELIPIEVKSL